MGKQQRVNYDNARVASRSRHRDEELVHAKPTHQDDRRIGI